MKLIKNLNSSEDPFNFANNLSVEQLEELILYTSDKYYNEKPVISDARWDILVDFLRLKNPKSKVLKEVGSSIKSKDKVKLPYFLGSMAKIKPSSNKLKPWKQKYPGKYILSDKLDGVSGLLVYTFDKEIKLYTRGTSTYGMDISPIIKYLPNIPTYGTVEKYCSDRKIKGAKNLIAFRGELIISKKIFARNWQDKMKNTRNTVSGLVNSKNINPKLAGDTRLVMYEVVDPIYKITKQYDIIKELHYNRVHHKKVSDISFEYLSQYLIKRKANSKYDIDGIIVTNNNVHQRTETKYPDYAFAFKDILEEQKATSTIVDIEWNKSKDGYINPTIIIEPVKICGVTIQRVTANNAKFVQDNMLGKGAVIEIIRSGDVIPKIERIIKKAEQADLPTGNYKWTKSGVDIISTDLSCREIIVKNIYYFFSTLNTKGMGERIVEKLYDGGVDSIEKVLKLSKDDILSNSQITGFKEKSAENLINAIKKGTTNITLAHLMQASNKLGHGMGLERAKSVLAKYPDILSKYQSWTRAEFILYLKTLDGWEDKTSTMFVTNFPDFIKFYNNIKKYISIIEPKVVYETGKFKDKKIVLSGFRDKELVEYLELEGAIIANSISKNTDILIIKDESVANTSKVQKAKELGIMIKVRNDF
jgi:DNA ligase (NAD+)